MYNYTGECAIVCTTFTDHWNNNIRSIIINVRQYDEHEKCPDAFAWIHDIPKMLIKLCHLTVHFPNLRPERAGEHHDEDVQYAENHLKLIFYSPATDFENVVEKYERGKQQNKKPLDSQRAIHIPNYFLCVLCR